MGREGSWRPFFIGFGDARAHDLPGTNHQGIWAPRSGEWYSQNCWKSSLRPVRHTWPSTPCRSSGHASWPRPHAAARAARLLSARFGVPLVRPPPAFPSSGPSWHDCSLLLLREIRAEQAIFITVVGACQIIPASTVSCIARLELCRLWPIKGYRTKELP